MKEYLDNIYNKYNKRFFVCPDPLQFLYYYDDILDREIVGFIASSLAYGRVAQIIKSIASVLDRMAPSPRSFLEKTSVCVMRDIFSSFRHRFTDGKELSELLTGIKCVITEHGSLNQCFKKIFLHHDGTLLPALSLFVEELRGTSTGEYNSLLPSPSKGSACKRLNLFLRWMVRKDEVDPGGWTGLSPAILIVPLDTHMHRIGRKLGFTERGQADMKTALDITRSFREMCPEDPVRYDFALTRLGIRSDISYEEQLIGMPAAKGTIGLADKKANYRRLSDHGMPEASISGHSQDGA
ncbi:MAG: TIGR02757 family protein [Deltaproteobacteria bacterium]|nr:TIGR02757 family protein [Deltaproteobacteria bacterium]